MVDAIAVGTASVNWGFDPLYTWVATPPFDQMLDEMVLAGYSATEISYNFPDSVELVAWELQRRRLRATATFHAVNLRERANHETALESSMPTRMTKIHTSSCTCVVAFGTASKMKVIKATPVTP